MTQGGPLQPRLRRALWTLGPALAVVALQEVFWPVSAGTFVSGLIIGGLGALGALGLALIWRANRIVNFAQGDLGTLPVTLVLLMIEAWKLPYAAALGIGVVAAIVLGALIELLIIRRFTKSSRLIVTVATIGLSQLLTFGALLLPRAWGLLPSDRTYAPPFSLSFSIGAVVFDANDVLAAVVAPCCMVALIMFLRATDSGVAIRAAAERSDRASLLGVPVRRLQTQVWVIATVLSFISVFFSAGVTSLPLGIGVSFTVILRSMAALVMGRMTNLATIATSAVSLGLLDAGIRANEPNSNLLPVLLVVIIGVALLAQRQSPSRVAQEDDIGWSGEEVRPIPAELAAHPLVRWVRWGGGTVLLTGAAIFPFLVGTGTALKAGAMLVFATIGVSLVVLAGWAGQVSLAQMTFVGAGGAVCAWTTVERGLDPLISLLAAGIVGAMVAVLVGLPALRLRGLYLAVITLGLSLATSAAVFNNSFVDWIPVGSFNRPSLLGRLSLDSATRVYELALVVFVLAATAVVGIRRSRTGRVLLALRENERAAVSYGISATRAKLTAFALSGFIAAVAGAVFVINQASFQSLSFDSNASVSVFVTAVIGGLCTITGAALGALYLRGAQWLLPGSWQLFASSAGVLVVLMVLPDGLGGIVFKLRDAALRSLARRTGIRAPGFISAAEEANRLEVEPELPGAA